VLPPGGPLLQEFAEHLAADVKKLVVDEDTGAQAFKYVKAGTNHYSLAFTYDQIAATQDRCSGRAYVGWHSHEEFFGRFDLAHRQRGNVWDGQF